MADRSPRRIRRPPYAILIGIGVLAAAGAALWWFMPAIAGGVVVDRLAAMGLPSPELALVRVGFGRAVATNLAVGTARELTAEQVVVDYSIPDIFQGEVDAVILRGASLEASLGPDGLSLGSLDPLLRREAGGGPPAIPPISLEDATVTIATGFGTVTMTGGGAITGTADDIAIRLDIAATAPRASAEGILSVKAAGPDIDARLALTGGRIVLPELASATITGELRATLSARKLAAIEGRLAVAGLRLDDRHADPLGPLAGSVVLDGKPGAWRATASLSDAAESFGLELRAGTPEPALDREVTLAADLDVTAAAPLWRLAGAPQPTAGSLSLDVVTVVNPGGLLEAAGRGRMPELAGSVTLDLNDLAFADALSTLSATAGIDVETDPDGAIRLTSSAPILADIAIDRSMLSGSALPPDLAAFLGRPLVAAIELPGPVELRRHGGDTHAAGTATVSIDLTDGSNLLDASGSAVIRFGGEAGFAYQLTGLDVTLDLPDGAGLPSAALALAGSASGEEGAGTAELSLAAAAPMIEAGALRMSGAKLDLPLTLDHADGKISARLAGSGSLSAARVTGLAPLRVAGPVQLAFSPRDVPFLVMDVTNTEGPHGTLDLTTGPLRLAGTVETGNGTAEGKLSLSSVRIRADLGAEGWSGGLSADDGSLVVPAYQFEAGHLDISADLPAGGAAELSLTSTFAHRAEPALAVPLSASLAARRNGNEWTFEGRAADAFDRLSIDVEGSHDLSLNRGSGKLRVKPIEFAPNIRQPEDLAPFLAGVAEDVSGTIALAGELFWSAEGVGSDLELLLRDVSATTAAAAFDRLNGVIEVDGLYPFSTAPGQRVAVAAIDAGLPLTDGLLTFRVTPGPRLEIADGVLHLAGGTVNLEPLTYDPEADSNEGVLTVTDVDLGRLLALAQVDGLTGTGKLSGRIPVRLVPGDLVIEGGELEAEEPGSLSYAPLVPPAALQGQDETVSLALSALTNFQYQQLRLTVDRQAGGEMVVGMHIRGKNPDFYEGYPVEFNLNLSGALDRVLRQSLAGYRIPEAIEQQLKDFAQ